MNLRQSIVLAVAAFGAVSSLPHARAEPLTTGALSAGAAGVQGGEAVLVGGGHGGGGHGGHGGFHGGGGYGGGAHAFSNSGFGGYRSANRFQSLRVARGDRSHFEHRGHEGREGRGRYRHFYRGYGYGYGFDDYGYDGGYSYGIGYSGSCYANCREEHGPRYCAAYASNYCD